MSKHKEKALLKAKQGGGAVDIAICPITDEELYFSAESNMRYAFQNYGTCAVCDNDCHYTALIGMDSVAQSSWPVRYFGYVCQTCFEKDSNEVPEKDSDS